MIVRTTHMKTPKNAEIPITIPVPARMIWNISSDRSCGRGS